MRPSLSIVARATRWSWLTLLLLLVCSSVMLAGVVLGMEVESEGESWDYVASAGGVSYEQVRGRPYVVDYDHRSVRINGQRVLLQAAGIHYPRSSPTMWPQLMAATKAAALCLSVACRYVFHNYHESVKGVWDWSTESRNLSRFLQAAADAELFVNLRIGPYICGEVHSHRCTTHIPLLTHDRCSASHTPCRVVWRFVGAAACSGTLEGNLCGCMALA